MIDTRVLTGAALYGALDDVARLRITVFRDWPYLYDGDLAYEQSYLDTYRTSEGAVVVGAFDGDRLIGASTGAPMMDHAHEFAAAFENTGYNLSQVFYCAESVLLAEYRGHGIGHQFFDLRESHARELGARYCAFCSVVRPMHHPMRPDEARALDPFWRGRGYAPLEGVQASFTWKDVDQDEETAKPLQFWIRALSN